jgi:hypothetical protein
LPKPDVLMTNPFFLKGWWSFPMFWHRPVIFKGFRRLRYIYILYIQYIYLTYLLPPSEPSTWIWIPTRCLHILPNQKEKYLKRPRRGWGCGWPCLSLWFKIRRNKSCPKPASADPTFENKSTSLSMTQVFEGFFRKWVDMSRHEAMACLAHGIDSWFRLKFPQCTSNLDCRLKNCNKQGLLQGITWLTWRVRGGAENTPWWP